MGYFDADARAARLQRTRSLGRSRYVLVWGVLFWGISTAVLMSGALVLIGDLERSEWLGWLRGALPVFMVGGVAWGLVTWHVSVVKRNDDDRERR